MCKKHQPILVYDCGGTQQYCGKCGKTLGEWKENSKPKKHPKKEKNGSTKV
jgi:hypothetical protein